MNKSNLIRVFSILLAVSMIFSFYGCKKNGNVDNSTTESNGKIVQPSIKDGTAVITYTSLNEAGDEVDVTNIITSVNPGSYSYGSIGSNIGQTIKDDNDKTEFVESAKDDYNMTDDEAKDVVDNADDWATFYFIVYIANTNSKAVSFRALSAKSTDSIKVNLNLGCVYGLDPGKAMGVPVEGMFKASEYEEIESLAAELNKMDIELQCSYVGGSFVKGTAIEISDWDKATIKPMPLTIDISAN